MKRRKLIFVIVVFVLLFATMFLVSCAHQHEVLKWRTIVEPTCMTEGMQRGACAECGEVVEEAMAPVAENHVWGNWEVTVCPTFELTGTGKVTRVCTENHEHTQSVTLPILTPEGVGYKDGAYEIFEEPTVVSEGKLSAIYESQYGEIAIAITVPKKEFDPESVEDAVLLGSSNRDMIRKGSGVIDIGYNSDGKPNYGSFNYEYGTDYVHTVYVGEQEKWISLTSEGQVFAMMKDYRSEDKSIKTYSKANENDLTGFYYTLSRADKEFYGAEGLLYNAYLWGSANINGDFKETIYKTKIKDTSGNVVNANGEYVYSFSFGYYCVTQQNFCQVTCYFMLTEEGALKYIRMNVNSYVKDLDGKGTAQFITWNNKVTNVTMAKLVNNPGNPPYKEVIEYHQDLKTDYPDEPKHEYTEEAFKIADFTVWYKDDDGTEKQVTEGVTEDTPDLQTGGNSVLKLTIKDISPSTATLDRDPISVYRITETGIRIKASFDSNTDPIWFTSNGNTLTVRSKIAGNIQLALVTKTCEKIITIACIPSAPQVLYPSVNEYHDAGYVWNQSTNSKATATIYVGQPLEMKAVISSEGAEYVDPSYRAEVGSAIDLNGVAIAEDGYTLTQDQNVSFKANVAGEYVIKMKSTAQKGFAVATVTVTVKPAPSITDRLSGKYYANFKKFQASIVFEPDVDGAVLATVQTNKGTEILKVVYDAELNIIKGAGEDARDQHYGGANLGVTISFNEVYKPVLSNPTGFGSGREKAIMYLEPDIDEMLACKYSAVFEGFEATVSFTEIKIDDTDKTNLKYSAQATVTKIVTSEDASGAPVVTKTVEILSVSYNPNKHMFTAEHADGEELGFDIELELDEDAYKNVFVLTAPVSDDKTQSTTMVVVIPEE